MMIYDTISMQEYQNLACSYRPEVKETPILAYLVMALNGEAGEVAEKVKRIYRGDEGTEEFAYRDTIAKELGDVLWNVANIADAIGMPLGLIARRNLEKMEARKQKGTLKGSGDNR